MSEPTKEALELAELIDCFACGKLRFHKGIGTTATLIDAHTASLREELRAAREALNKARVGLTIASRWQTEMEPFRTEVMLVLSDLNAARAACKGGDAV